MRVDLIYILIDKQLKRGEITRSLMFVKHVYP